jgi:hypothetical protein
MNRVKISKAGGYSPLLAKHLLNAGPSLFSCLFYTVIRAARGRSAIVDANAE